ncbi:MAG: transglutaminaseTgpA domain-containing protein [Acetatifactor sp.]|nr:transglutaminaseTgpA domain-containing protein [Acetatifactor sp.]
MKNRESFLFSIILLLINTVGVAGALLNCLGMDFGAVLQPALFLWGMFLLCLMSGVLWSTQNRTRMAWQWFLFIAVFLICILLFRRNLAVGFSWALRGILERINERYGIHLILNLIPEADLLELGMENVTRQATWSILFVMLPLVLLLGCAVVRKRALALLLADTVWFVAACTMDDFPAYVWFVLCILGFAAVVIRNAFQDDERAGMQAVLIGTAALGVVMALVYRFAVPFMDSRYDAVQEARIELNRKINEEWIPGIKSRLARIGSGPGTDVTGELTRKAGTVYTSEEVYRVTFSYAPKSTVYLRGFVGKDYAGDQWKAAGDSDLKNYYRRKSWELPESAGDLVNLTYDVFRYRASEKVWVEELAAPGSYTVYPYGAQLTEDYKVHWDGSAEWKRVSWEFQYSAPENYSSEKMLAGTAAENEARYRDYVYDTFCEYPAESFPELTDFLENAGFRTDSVYNSLEDVLTYLTGNAVYNLDVPNTPRGQDFVEYFLFESREGYCAHFASSAVLILRYLGIPARYATGYAAAPGDFSRNSDGTYSAVILDKQAHAWAEVYLDGIGWIPVEMTPGAAPFPGDNTAEQLVLAGQLAGESGSEGAIPAWQGSPVGSNSHAGQEPVGDDDSEQENSEKDNSDEVDDPNEDELNQEGSAGPDESGEEKSNQEGSDEAAGSDQGESNQEGFSGFGIFGQIAPGQGADSQNPGSGVTQQGNQGDSGAAVGQPGNQGNSGAAVGQPDDGRASGDDSGTDDYYESISGRDILAVAMAVLEYIMRAMCLLLLCVIIVVIWKLTWILIRRRSCGRLQRAESREKVFLLYRNIRRLLAAVGCTQRLNRSDENTAEFNVLLEKCGFGEKEPAPEEVQTAREFCERLAKEVYSGLPSYRKPLFWGLDVYGFVR